MPGFVIVLMRRPPRGSPAARLHAEVAGEHALVARAQLAALDHDAPADQQRVDQRARAHRQRRHRVGDPRVVDAVDPPQGDVGHLAGLERADLGLAAEAAGAVDGAELQRLAGGQRPRAVAGQPRDEHRLAQLPAQLARLVGGGAVDAQADRRAFAHQRGDGGDAGAEPGVGAGAVRDPGAGLAEAAHLGVVEVHAVREPHVVAQPAELFEVLDRAAAEQLQAELLLVLGLGHVRVQADAARAGQLGRLAHQLLGDAERGAGRERDPHHRVRRGVVVAVDRGLAGGEDRVAVLGHLVGRQPAVGAPEVHRAAARVEADAELPRDVDLHREQVAAVAGEQVVVVGGGRAAGLRERGQPGLGGGALDLLVDVRPHGVERLQPLEQRRLLGEAAGRPLVEVVVAVDEPGRGEHAAAVDADVAVLGARRGPAPTSSMKPWRMTMCPSACSVPVARRRWRSRSARRRAGSSRLGGRADRVEDLLVARAAAQVAGQRLADLGVARVRLALQQVVGGDDQPGRAEAALDGARGEERLLDRVQLVLGARAPRR